MNDNLNPNQAEQAEILPENIDDIALESGEIWAMVARKYKKLARTARTHESRSIKFAQQVNQLRGENEALKEKVQKLEEAANKKAAASKK